MINDCLQSEQYSTGQMNYFYRNKKWAGTAIQ